MSNIMIPMWLLQSRDIVLDSSMWEKLLFLLFFEEEIYRKILFVEWHFFLPQAS